MAPLRTSMRSIAEHPTISLAGGNANSTFATIKHHTSAARRSESGRARGTQARKKACEYCYRVHKRCAGTFPCERCIKAGCAAECTEHKRQRHARRGDAPRAGYSGPPSRTTAISSSIPFPRTANDQTHSSIPVEHDFRGAATVPVAQCYRDSEPPSLPRSRDPAAHAVVPGTHSPQTLAVSPVLARVDTLSSPSLTDSSTASESDESASPIMDVLDAWLADLASAQQNWMTDPAVAAWDTGPTLGHLEQQHGARGSVVSQQQLQMLFEDPELWGLIETLQIPPVAGHGPQPPSSSGSSSGCRPVSPGLFLT